MIAWLLLLNGVAVTVFGGILSASFCGVLTIQKNYLRLAYGIAVLLFLQAAAYILVDVEVLRKLYPLIAHLPLWVMLYLLSGEKLWPFFSILFAYLCCQLRRWLALVVVAIYPQNLHLQDVTELIITVPLLLLLLHFMAPTLCQLSKHSTKIKWAYGVIPVLYYVFDYLTRVYTDLLTSGSSVVVEFMPFVCCLTYLVFLVYNTLESQKLKKLQQRQKSLDLQLNQSVHEIQAMRESQELASTYRHDLRHHLQYVSACIENGQSELAQTYISGVCQEIAAYKVQRYCENESANLILSSFEGRAKKEGIDMKIEGTLPSKIRVSDQDLCVLLSNALENALHACQAVMVTGKAAIIDVRFYVKEERIFLQIKNSSKPDVCFRNDIPVSQEPGHGIGVQSICAIAEKNRGIYTFELQDGIFIFRISL